MGPLDGRRAFGLALVLALVWTARELAFAFDIVQISPASERRLGKEIDAYVRTHRKFDRNQIWRARLALLGARLAAAADPARTNTWVFRVTREEHVNMMSSCAGYVYVTTGVMNASFSDDELAGMLAHEMAHIMKHHVAKSYALEYRTLVFDDATVDRALEDLRMYRNGPGGPYGLYTFGRRFMSRDFEREADINGVHYAADAGFDAMGHARVLRRLLKPSKGPKNWKDRLLLSHPPADERIRVLEEEARRYKGRS